MNGPEHPELTRQGLDRMLKLVAKGFYNELINYGVRPEHVLQVTGHLLDNILQKQNPTKPGADYYNRLFRMPDIRDDWAVSQRFSVHEVTLTPFTSVHQAHALTWVTTPTVQKHFYPPFPATAEELAEYLEGSDRLYFTVLYQDKPVGLIGAENIDHQASKVEMRKLIGDPNLRGKGIGKRATFLFLYYIFVILNFNKVYLHSLDINVRNINLNSQFGFELEGVFFEEAQIEDRRLDVVRMGLRAPVWLTLFS